MNKLLANTVAQTGFNIMKITILEDANIHYQRICWHVPVEYDGKKYMIVADEDDNQGDRALHEYDEDRRHNIGNEYSGDDYDELYEKIIEVLSDYGELGSYVKKGTVVETED
jgi:hypothetical protein